MRVGALTIKAVPSMMTEEVVILPVSKPLQTEVGVMTESQMVKKRPTQHMHTVVLHMSKPNMMKEVPRSDP